MIYELLRKLLKLEENDKEIESLQKKAYKEIGQTTLTLKKAGVLHEIMVKKTTTFYIGKAMGAIN